MPERVEPEEGERLACELRWSRATAGWPASRP
jgi:hypothetical protein